MHPVSALERLGGVGRRGQLHRLVDRHELGRLVESGDVLRDARGRYSLPTAAVARRAANALSGVVSHRSAAAAWGWETKLVPVLPEITVRRNRRLTPAQRRLVQAHWADLGPDDVVDGVTSRSRTLLDCLTRLPVDEALAVADSALRHQHVSGTHLMAVAAGARGPGAMKARRVARLADARAANPFESVLRAISLDVTGLTLVPQVVIEGPDFRVRPDLVDRDLRLVVEADSHTWHSSREALRRDCRRYCQLTVSGWLVLRFTWEDVMHDPEFVERTLSAAVPVAHQHAHHPKRA